MFGVYLTKVKCTLNVDNNLSILKNKMSKITRKIELIPDIENLTHEESNQRCYKVFYNIDNKLYKVANLLVCQLFGLDNLLSLMRLQNDEYVSLPTVQLKIAIMLKIFHLIYLILSNRMFSSILMKQRKNN